MPKVNKILEMYLDTVSEHVQELFDKYLELIHELENAFNSKDQDERYKTYVFIMGFSLCMEKYLDSSFEERIKYVGENLSNFANKHFN